MVTETEEKVTTGEEEQEQKPEEESAEKVEVVEPEPITFKTQEDLDKHIISQATSIANKSTATYQQQVEELKKEIKATKSQLEDKHEDDALTRLEKAQTKEWEDDAKDVGEFQSAVRNLIKERREFRQQVEEWEEKHEKATQSVKEVNAFTKALALLLPEDEGGFVSSLTALAEKLAGADTDREADLIYQLEEARLKSKAEVKPKKTRPDSNIPSASGGKDWSKASAEEKVTEGLRQDLQKRK